MELTNLPPATVLVIDSSSVQIGHLTDRIARKLRRRGRRIRRRQDGAAIDFEPQDGPPSENESLVRLLQDLADVGVGFQRDPKQGWAPADIVSEMVRRGRIFHGARATSFDGTNWLIEPHPWGPAGEETELDDHLASTSRFQGQERQGRPWRRSGCFTDLWLEVVGYVLAAVCAGVGAVIVGSIRSLHERAPGWAVVIEVFLAVYGIYGIGVAASGRLSFEKDGQQGRFSILDLFVLRRLWWLFRVGAVAWLGFAALAAFGAMVWH